MEPAAVRIERTTPASRVGAIGGALVLLVLGGLPAWGDPSTMRILVEFIALLVLAQMWNLLAGYAGLVSIGQQAYVGLGGYALIVLADDLGVNPFLAVPLAVTGALLTLLVFKSTINLYSQIGMILLIGLVTKNSILLVEFANQLKDRGLDTVAAVLESGRVRLRPIVMTSVSTIMGAMPIAFGLGAGSMSRKPLGYAIIGGILFSTVLTLFLVPVAYVLLDRLRERMARRAPALRPVEAE